MAKLEDNFEKLEAIIDKLESDETGLEESFKIYEQGMKILAQCNSEIDKVEKKVLKLMEDGKTEEFADLEKDKRLTE